jgi:hypothetical protein
VPLYGCSFGFASMKAEHLRERVRTLIESCGAGLEAFGPLGGAPPKRFPSSAETSRRAKPWPTRRGLLPGPTVHREQPQSTDTRARAQQSKKKDDQDHRQMPRPEEPCQTVDQWHPRSDTSPKHRATWEVACVEPHGTRLQGSCSATVGVEMLLRAYTKRTRAR